MKLENLKGETFKVFISTPAEYSKVIEIGKMAGYRPWLSDLHGGPFEGFAIYPSFGISFYNTMDYLDGIATMDHVQGFPAADFIAANTPDVANPHGDDFLHADAVIPEHLKY